MTGQRVHRTLFAVDIEQYGRLDRDDRVRLRLRQALRQAITVAIATAQLDLSRHLVTDRGDGLLAVFQGDVNKAKLLEAILGPFAEELNDYNQMSSEIARMRVRVVVHAGEVLLDEDATPVGEQVNLACRLLDAELLRALLRTADGPLVLCVSSYVYDQVVRHEAAMGAVGFVPVEIEEKETHLQAWVCAPVDPGFVGRVRRQQQDGGQPTSAGTSGGAMPINEPLPGDTAEPFAVREERRVVTALVAGIAGTSTTDDDPEDTKAREAQALGVILHALGQYGGTVVTVLGGTVLAVFGVPKAREDDPERAVRAALTICQDPAAGATIRAGVETGPAIVAPRPEGSGLAGGRVTLAGGVSGAVLDTAVELHLAARPGCMLVGPAAHRATRRRIDFEPVGSAWHPVAPWSRIGLVVEQDDRVRLVEREYELALLTGTLARVKHGRIPQLITLVGPPGIGKTRLVAELGRQAETDPELITWRQGRSLPHSERVDAEGEPGGVLFRALAEIVRAHAGLLDTDPTQAVEAKLQRSVIDALRTGPDVPIVERHLRLLVQLATHDTDPGQRQVAFTAWRRFFEAVADDRPLVLIFEDLHWADPTLLAFIDELVDRARPVPLLVVCTARPELLAHRPGWGGGKLNTATVSLGPLSQAGAASLLDDLLGFSGLPPLDALTRDRLLASAGGNPLFLEEYVRMLRDRGPGGNLPIPETVQQIITARIDQLDDPDRRLLQDLAVVGEPISVGPLTTLTTLPTDTLRAALARLERQELLGRVRAATPEPAYVFWHALIREIAYNQILRADRAVKHRDVAAWLEANGTDQVELLAHHYEQALALAGIAGQGLEVADRARVAFRAAGDRAAGLGAAATAARHYARALELWPADDPDRPELLFRLGEARIYGEHSSEDVLIQARDALEVAGRLDRALEADVLLALAARSRNDGAAAEGHLDRALTRPTGSSRARALALATRAVDLMIQDRYDAALVAGREALCMGEALGYPYAEGLALEAIGTARLKRGDLGGEADLARCIAVLDQQRNPAVHYCRFDLAWGLWWLGDLAGCAQATAKGRRAAEEVHAATIRWFDAVQAGLDYAAGRWDAVVAAADRLLGGELSDEDGYLAPWYRILRARVLLARAGPGGDLDRALGDTKAALEAAAVGHDTRYRQVALALHGRVLLAGGGRDAAASLDQLLAEQRAEPDRACATPDLAMLLVDLDQPPGSLPDGLPPTRWHEAVRAFVGRDFTKAAELYATIGSPVDEQAARARSLEGV